MNKYHVSRNTLKKYIEYIAKKNCIWYNNQATTPRQEQKGGVLLLDTILSFMLSILASVIAYYVCKWLDGE